jgi:hypothetical protein
MTIRCFRWDDAGAPQLGAASSLSVVLEKCLVDGYGTQAGLGWGKIKSPSGKVIAFQPQARAASRPWLAFDDRCLASMYGVNLRGAAPMALFSVLTGLNDDGTSSAGSVNAVPFAQTSYLAYRRIDDEALPWLLLADSELDYFYLLLPFCGESINAGVAGKVKNMGGEVERRNIAFSTTVFGSLPGSMIENDSGAFIWPGKSLLNPYESGSVSNSTPTTSLPVAGYESDLYQFYRNGSGGAPSSLVRLCNSPLVADSRLGGRMPLIKTPNPYGNRLVLIPANIGLYCLDALLLRGRLGGLICSMNDRNIWRYGIDNCGSPLVQNIGGGDRRLLPVLVSITAISQYSRLDGDQANFMFFDLTGPW